MRKDITKKARDKVFQKIGRNVVNYQRLEGLLKALLKSSRFRGNPDNLISRVEKQNNSIEMKSMGSLVGLTFDTVFSEKAHPEPPEDMDQVWISMKFEIQLDPKEREQLKLTLAELVKERNALIHHKLIHTDFNSISICKALEEELDAVNEKFAPHYRRIQSLLKSKADTQNHILKLLDSAEFKKLTNEQ